MSNKPIVRWIVALSLGGVIATLVHVLIVSDLGLAVANLTVYAIAIRLSFEVPDLIYGGEDAKMPKEAGYTAVLVAIVSGLTITITSVDDALRIGIVTLVLGVSILMMMYGVWIERARQEAIDSAPRKSG